MWLLPPEVSINIQKKVFLSRFWYFYRVFEIKNIDLKTIPFGQIIVDFTDWKFASGKMHFTTSNYTSKNHLVAR